MNRSNPKAPRCETAETLSPSPIRVRTREALEASVHSAVPSEVRHFASGGTGSDFRPTWLSWCCVNHSNRHCYFQCNGVSETDCETQDTLNENDWSGPERNAAFPNDCSEGTRYVRFRWGIFLTGFIPASCVHVVWTIEFPHWFQ